MGTVRITVLVVWLLGCAIWSQAATVHLEGMEFEAPSAWERVDRDRDKADSVLAILECSAERDQPAMTACVWSRYNRQPTTEQECVGWSDAEARANVQLHAGAQIITLTVGGKPHTAIRYVDGQKTSFAVTFIHPRAAGTAVITVSKVVESLPLPAARLLAALPAIVSASDSQAGGVSPVPAGQTQPPNAAPAVAPAAAPAPVSAPPGAQPPAGQVQRADSPDVSLPVPAGWSRAEAAVEQQAGGVVLVRNGAPRQVILAQQKPLGTFATAEEANNAKAGVIVQAILGETDNPVTNIAFSGTQTESIRSGNGDQTMFLIPYVRGTQLCAVLVRVDEKRDALPPEVLAILQGARVEGWPAGAAAGTSATGMPAAAPTAMAPAAPATPVDSATPDAGTSSDSTAASDVTAPSPTLAKTGQSQFDAADELTEKQIASLPADIKVELKAVKAMGNDTLWTNVGTLQAMDLPRNVEPAPAVDTSALYQLADLHPRAAISSAMQMHRLTIGPMTPQQEKQFGAKWGAMMQNPTKPVVDYFRKAGPLMAEHNSLRARMAAAAVDYDLVMQEAQVAFSEDGSDALDGMFLESALLTDEIASYQARLSQVTDLLLSLGDPPNPVKSKALLALKHQDALRQMRALMGTDEGSWVLENVVTGPSTIGNTWSATVDGQRVTPAPKATQQRKGNVIVSAGGDGMSDVASDDKPATTLRFTWAEPPSRLAPVPIGIWEGLRRQMREAKKQADAEATKDAAPAQVDKSDPATAAFLRSVDDTFAAAAAVGEEMTLPDDLQGCQPAWAQAPESVLACRFVWDPANDKLFASRATAQNIRVRFTLRQGQSYIWSDIQHDNDGMKMLVPRPTIFNGKLKDVLEVALDFPIERSPVITYVYRWDPTGAATPFRRPDSGQIANLAPAPSSPTESLNMSPDEINRCIGEYQKEIGQYQEDIERYKQAMQTAKTPDDRKHFDWLIMAREADIQLQKDRIQTLQTGQYTHTYTGFDTYCQRQATNDFAKWCNDRAAYQRIVQGTNRLIEMLPPSGNRETIRAQMRTQLAKNGGVRDLATAQRLSAYVQKQLNLSLANDRDKWQLRGDEAEAFEDSCQKLKTTCDVAINVLGGGAAAPILYAYTAATGYVEGGPMGAIRSASSTYSAAASSAWSIYDGYKKGDIAGALKDAVYDWAARQAIQSIATRIAGGNAGKPKSDVPKPTWKEVVNADRWKQEMDMGRAQMRRFNEAQTRLLEAGRNGASPQVISQLQAEARQMAIVINSSPTAKNVLKYRANPTLKRAFDTHVRTVYAEVDARVIKRMEDQKWNTKDWATRDFRNASSMGTPNMDRDWGLVEHEGMELLRDGQTVTKYQWCEDASAAYKDAYKEVTGRSSSGAFQTVTYSGHPEAFKDCAVLNGRIAQADPKWAGQSMDVIRYKIDHAQHDTASFYVNQMEASRQLSKEITTKIGPFINVATPTGLPGTPEYLKQLQRIQETQDHVRALRDLTNEFGEGRIDPLSYRERMWQLTGGKTLNQVTEQITTIAEGAKKSQR